ncbi:MAG: ATP-dependent zinc metalloprotease FtsH [Planctomycetota bacterium]
MRQYSENKNKSAQKKQFKGIPAWLLLIAFFVALFFLAQNTLLSPPSEPPSINKFYELLSEGKIKEVKIGKNTTTIVLREKTSGKNSIELSVSEDFMNKHAAKLVVPSAGNPVNPTDPENPLNPNPPKVLYEEEDGFFYNFLAMFGLPILLFVVLWFFLFRQFKGTAGAGNVFSFGRSRARLASKERTRVTFSDVAGIDEAKSEVSELIEFLKNPSKFKKIGARIPRGVILIGPPGTGKTLLAKAIAGEAGVPFFSISGSDFVEMFVGVGASRVRDLFNQARENAPCIIFLDEIDAVGRRRGSGLGGGHDEREQTLNAILVEMDGFDTDTGIIIVAATNRPDVLDPALLRPGRFDREIVIDLPDIKGREAILNVHAKNVKIEKEVDLSVIARGTPMFSGAELEAIINEAALQAVMKGKDKVNIECLEEARDKIHWGRQKTSRVMAEEDKKLTAYHESGHALIANMIPDVDPLHKVTIIPRGIALGATMQLPEKERYTLRKKNILGTVCMLLAGRITEEMFCEDISSGAQNDIKKATELVRLMICEWGMSENIGPINYSISHDNVFLGREFTGPKNYSEAMAVKIDEEIKRIISEQETRTRKILEENRENIERIAQGLLKHEVLGGEEVKRLLKGESLEDIKGINNSTSVQTLVPHEEEKEVKDKN